MSKAEWKALGKEAGWAEEARAREAEEKQPCAHCGRPRPLSDLVPEVDESGQATGKMIGRGCARTLEKRRTQNANDVNETKEAATESMDDNTPCKCRECGETCTLGELTGPDGVNPKCPSCKSKYVTKNYKEKEASTEETVKEASDEVIAEIAVEEIAEELSLQEKLENAFIR